MKPNVRYVESRNSRYIYEIDGLMVDLKNRYDHNDILNKLGFVSKSLEHKVNFRDVKIDMALRDFMLFGYLFFKAELSEYFIFYIEKLILNCDKKKLTEVLILKYLFNVRMGEVQLTIHNSTDKSDEKYNSKIMEFVTEQIFLGKKHLVKKLLINKDKVTISKIIKLITLNSFLQICGNDYFDEAISYFDFVVKEVLLPTNMQLSLNGIIGSATGLSKKEAKDIKNIFKSDEKDKLYNEINNLMNSRKPDFYLFTKECKYLKNLEEALDSKSKLNEGALATLKPSRVLKICMELFSEKFTIRINQTCNELIQRNTIINRVNIIMELFVDVNSTKANHIYTHYKMNYPNTMLEDLIVTNYKNQIKSLDNPNINFQNDIWIFYWRKLERCDKVSINFSELNHNPLKSQIKQYFQYRINMAYAYKSDGDDRPRVITSFHLVIKSIIYLQNTFSISTIEDIKLIHVHKLVKYLQNDYKQTNNTNIRVSTITSCISFLKAFVDWYIQNNSISLTNQLYNPFHYVVFKGVYNKNTDIIPEIVIDKILLHLNDLREDIQRMVLILLNCGLRFKEVAYLEEDCISESNDEYKILKYIPFKVLEARRRNGLDDYHRIVIEDELFTEIEKQIDYTRNLRDKYKVNEIFLTIGVNDNLCMISSSGFNSAVQKIVNKHNIVDNRGKLWIITNKQYRKTLAVDMITKGNANEHEVANYLGHLNRTTTKKYYAEVRKKKLADMNSDFFKKKFQLSMEESHLESFSEEERKALYVDFCLNIREVEYGVCTRPFSVDTCDSRCDIFGCATCSKICIGKKHHKRWMDLYENQKQRLISIVKKYESININYEVYQGFREYEREKYLLDSFKIVVDRLKGDYFDGY